MSKLDTIDDNLKLEFKILMLEVLIEAMKESQDIIEFSKLYRQKVRELWTT